MSLLFAAGFTHYGEENINNYANVEFRFNASLVLEPPILVLSALGLVVMVGFLRFKERARRA